MKKLIFGGLTAFVLTVAIYNMYQGCKKGNDEDYFCGEIVSVAVGNVPTSHVNGKVIELNDAFSGYMSAYDSLILFLSRQYGDKRIYMFNLSTNSLVSKLITIGKGPNDFYAFTHTEQFIVRNGCIKLWGWDDFSGKVKLLNLTQSIKEQRDVIDSTFIFDWKNNYTRPFGYIFHYKDNSLLIRSQLEMKNFEDYTPVEFFLSNLHYERIRSYNVYRKPIINRNKNAVHPENYYNSLDRIKPDRTKLAMGMSMLAQINILDTETGMIKGYRLENTPDFTYLARSPDDFKIFYQQTRVDDYFIFSLYSNTLLNNNSYPHVTNELHIFDWNGNFKHKIILDIYTSRIAFCPVRKNLYCISQEDELYCFDLSFLY